MLFAKINATNPLRKEQVNMFKMVSGGNGRSVYFGKVGSIDQEMFQLTGNEWDSEARVEVTQTLNLRKIRSLKERW